MKPVLSPPRRLIVVELFSDLGEQFVHLTLLARLFFGLADSTANLLWLCLIQQAPAILLGPLAGRCVDRLGPRRGLVGANLARLPLGLGLLYWINDWAVWGIYFIFVTASLVFVIARRCLTPGIVAPEHLIGYTALNERVALAAGIAGPFLIGLLIQRAGSGVALGVGLAMYTGSACLALGLPGGDAVTPEAGGSRSGGGNKGLADAWLAPLTDRRVGNWCLLMLVTGLVGGILNFGAPVFNRNFFQGDIVAWGAVMSGYQAGACLATWLVPALAARLSDRRLLTGCFISVGAGFILLAACPRLPLFAVVMAGLGCLFTLLAIFLESRIQRDCAEHRRGRIFSGLTALGGACLLAGIVTGAFVVHVGGVRWLLAMGAVLALAAGAVARHRSLPAACRGNG